MREYRELQTLIDELERHIVHQDKLLQAAVLAERAECAKLCDTIGDNTTNNDNYATGAYACGKEIRARGEK